MIGESSHSNSSSAASPQYEEIIQELSSLCTSSSSASARRLGSSTSNYDPSFFRGKLGSDAFIRYSTWKVKRKGQTEENLEEDEELLHLTKTVVQECMERCTTSEICDGSLSVWTNASFGSHILLSAIFHQLEQGEASYQELDKVEDFLERWIDNLATDGSEVSCDVMNGLAGTLQGIFFIRRELQRPDWAKKEAIRIATEILERGRKNSEARRFSSTAPLYWGKIFGEVDWTMSTGCAGILQSLLGLEINEWNEIEQKIPNALESLLEQTIKQLPAYGKMEYYSRSKSNRTMDGAAGHAILLLQSYVVLGSIGYLRQAQRLVRTVILPWCSAYMTDPSILPQDTILGLFDGVVGVCYCLWLSKERGTAKKLINKTIAYCRKQINAARPIDMSLANGVSGLVRLLQQIDNRGRDEVEIPFLSSALFNFDMEIHLPIREGMNDSSSLHERRRKRNEMKKMGRRHTSLPAQTDSSGHMRRSLQVTSLQLSKRWTSASDLDEDSHLSVSSFNKDEKPRKHSSIPIMRMKRRASNSHSVSSTSMSFSLKEEGENPPKTKLHGSIVPTAHDDSDDSSSFSTSSHMESATVDDQANAQYLAKQDSDNEEYISANVSLSLLPGRNISSDDSASSLEASQRKGPPIDRLSLFAKTRNQNLNMDSDSDSIDDHAPLPSCANKTPSISNRKSTSGSQSSKGTPNSRRTMLRSPKPQMHQWMTSSKRNLMAGMDDDEDIPGPSISSTSVPSPPLSSKFSLDEDNESIVESLNDEDCLAIARSDEMPDKNYLDTLEVSSRSTSRSAFTQHKPNSTQKKTLMDEESHGFVSVATDQFPSTRLEASIHEAENESGSETLNDEDTVGDDLRMGSLSEELNEDESESMDDDDDNFEEGDDLAIGSPDDLPSSAYLDSLDVSTRARAYDPYTNYKPVPVQKKTLMDEEGHGSKHKKLLQSASNGASSKSRRLSQSTSLSVDTDDDGTEDDEMAIGLPNELPNKAYLDAHDVSTRTRSYNPYADYKPAKAQQKTLMDEEGHGQLASADIDDDSIESIHGEAEMNEKPNSAYLARQDSSMDAYYDYKSTTTTMPLHDLLDEEDHLVLQPDVAGSSFDSFVAEEAEQDDEPNTKYLARQDSRLYDYYESSPGTTKMPSHQKDVARPPKQDNKSFIEEEIEEAIKNENKRNGL